jgi:1-acyl-sn-glycerol-3-phosphate acyltransferase
MLWVLNTLGVQNMRAMAMSRLLKLRLSGDDMRALKNALASRSWKHDRLFHTVVAELPGGNRLIRLSSHNNSYV